MPEGPEIRIAADRIAAVLVGHRVSVEFPGLPRLAGYRSALDGARVTAVDTRGKAMLTRFDRGLVLYSHNQLYGRWYVRRRGELPRTGRSLRVALHTDSQSALLYSASDVAVLDPAGEAAHPFLSRIGPDILDASLAWRDVARRLDAPEFRGRSLGALYLDQRFLAGVGNYLRSEILHFAGLHPALRPSALARRARNALGRESLAVARRSYETRGITNTPARVRSMRAAGETRGAYRFAVFGRDGRPCHRCGAPIERLDVAGRRLYLCAVCQPRASATSSAMASDEVRPGDSIP